MPQSGAPGAAQCAAFERALTLLLEMRGAEFTRQGRRLAGPVQLSLREGESASYACAGDRAASIIAMMAAGIVKATAGSVLVAAFDPRIQPVHVKRIVGYVSHEPLPLAFAGDRYIEYRAALWGLPRNQSVVRARRAVERMQGVHEAFAFPLAAALIAQPKLLVLDRPPAVYAAAIREAAGDCALFSTHVSQREAEHFRELATA